MNSAIDNIMSRRSVRNFTDRKISRADLETIVKCAFHAPSARNRQLWKFTVVQDKKLISELAVAVGTALKQGSDYNFYNPDTIILISAESDYIFKVQDCSCAMENIYLAANALGIGAVWINQLGDVDVGSVLRKLNLPSNHTVVVTAALGYSADGDDTAITAKRDDVAEWFL